MHSVLGSRNPGLDKLRIATVSPKDIKYTADLPGGINVIGGIALNEKSEQLQFTAIPYFLIGNVKPGDDYKVWIKNK